MISVRKIQRTSQWSPGKEPMGQELPVVSQRQVHLPFFTLLVMLQFANHLWSLQNTFPRFPCQLASYQILPVIRYQKEFRKQEGWKLSFFLSFICLQQGLSIPSMIPAAATAASCAVPVPARQLSSGLMVIRPWPCCSSTGRAAVPEGEHEYVPVIWNTLPCLPSPMSMSSSCLTQLLMTGLPHPPFFILSILQTSSLYYISSV